jgi:hypothetical protein
LSPRGLPFFDREFEQFVTDSADQLLRTVYLMDQGRSHAEHIYAKDQRLHPRAAAGAFSMQHGLLPKEGLPARLLA